MIQTQPFSKPAHCNGDLTAKIASQFGMPGEPVGMIPLGEGNINDTFLAFYRTSFSEARCVIQKINTRVFRDPQAVMRNFRTVTEHVHRKLERERSIADRIWQLPKIVPCMDGSDLFWDADDTTCWRAITLIDSAEAFNQAQSQDHAHEAGAVLGQFHRLVMDLNPKSLDVTIPGFHNTPGYLDAFDTVCQTQPAQDLIRNDTVVAQLCEFVNDRRAVCHVLQDALLRNELTVRIMHGDPKINNILIDRLTGRGTSIIDLDTVGAGLIHWDYGDAVRSICNPAGEEAADLSDVEFSLELCQAFTAGYLEQTADFLSVTDKAYLYDAIGLITFELGLRFLQDHLAGNVYFKVRHPRHNLERAAVQFRLCETIEAREPALRDLFQSNK